MKKTVTRQDMLKLASDSGLDPRTVKRAVEKGLSALRADIDRVRLAEAAKKSGFNAKGWGT